jgi:hypothetical protein
MKAVLSLALAFACSATGSSFAQDRTFNWVAANTESVRLDPGYYHAGHVYRPGSSGGNMHVDIESEKPVTIALAPEAEWNNATQHPERLRSLSFMCQQEHVTKTTYICNIPPQAMVLVIRDERPNTDGVVLATASAVRTGDRSIDRAIRAGVGSAIAISNTVPHKYVSPNDLHIQYYSWLCVDHCEQPEFRWYLKAKEKYQLTPILKVYGGIFPDHEGEQISVKIKSPVPMAVAVLPSSVANHLHASPEMLQQALASSSCQQRGVQSLSWDCPLNLADGPLSVVVVPESTSNVPHKKAEIEIYETKCVEHCGIPATQGNSEK